jgi:hypothetical protein
MSTSDYHTESYLLIPQSLANLHNPPKFGDPDPATNNHLDAFVP